MWARLPADPQVRDTVARGALHTALGSVLLGFRLSQVRSTWCESGTAVQCQQARCLGGHVGPCLGRGACQPFGVPLLSQRDPEMEGTGSLYSPWLPLSRLLG